VIPEEERHGAKGAAEAARFDCQPVRGPYRRTSSARNVGACALRGKRPPTRCLRCAVAQAPAPLSGPSGRMCSDAECFVELRPCVGFGGGEDGAEAATVLDAGEHIVDGVARTSRDGDRDDQPVAAGRSITLRNGACPIPDPRQNQKRASDRNVQATTNTMVDPNQLAPTHPHWAIWARDR